MIFGTHNLPEPLDMNGVDLIIRSYFENRDNITLSNEEVSLEQLAGSPEWTIVQMIDQFLVSIFNDRLYKKLRSNFTQYIPGLPQKSAPTLDYARQFFLLELAIRVNLDDNQRKIIMQRVEKATVEYEEGLYFTQDIVQVFKAMVQEVQRFEAIDDYSSYPGGATRKQAPSIIKKIIRDNDRLIDHYLSLRPEIMHLMDEYNNRIKV